jgi:SAM-dependent methyltransferase
MQEFWTRHNVTSHRSFASARESLDYLEHRNQSYPGYIDLLPVAGHDGKVILDFGCGPGNDLVGFGVYSRPRRLIGIDIATTSLEQASERLKLHDISANLLHVPYGTYELPVKSGSVDYIHCSGVLMYVEDPARLLREFRRILKPAGEVGLMAYNYDSVWLHLYVAYFLQTRNSLYSDRPLREAFMRSTDGEDCPFVHVWTPDEMAELAAASGFQALFKGAALSLWELSLLPRRFVAAMDARLPAESRNFLLELTLDDAGLPYYRGQCAGIDGCYRLKVAP